MAKILIVEDEEPIRELIKMNLSMVGYTVESACNGEDALLLINNTGYDLILLDLMIPKIDGFSLMKNISNLKIPVIIVTAKDNINDKIKGYNLGADDYLVKPFDSMELLLRVKALLKRCPSDNIQAKEIYTFDDVIIDIHKHSVTKDGKEVILTLKEFELLKELILNKNIVLSRDSLISNVWGYDYLGNTRTVDMHIQKLRNKLNTERIKTIFKIGYKLEY
ncbi:response regulator transcription factor [Oceanirhabdus sp. W0125-5]|uniref:response regulator transcription factor n=1 Tax=Oceanirhabdus sp. W0125-5 TaxID=2999116 RepID=UPI0022F2D49C|nr:response regulator transcription factor [Oceanirhabdus sp. W0125-5]WBW97650.1 response regulator transcription factor [Oceanirhabdus sp. W0125-5]